MRAASDSLVGHFLIAMPAMTDPHFARSLIFVCEHSNTGALGLVINRPIDMNLAGLFERVNLPLDNDPQNPVRSRLAQLPVYFGGPVQTDRGFVLHRPCGKWNATIEIDDEVGLTSSRDILQAMSDKGEPSDVLIALGYAGWTAGQIEREIAQNAWLTVIADADIVFKTPPEGRFAAALSLLGIDFYNLSGVAGHA